ISKKNKLIDKKIKQEGFEVIVLKDKIGLKEDLKDTINIIKSRRTDVMITDSYATPSAFLSSLLNPTLIRLFLLIYLFSNT
ncbi:unnamed protein product, partial [marine sediment metagenome]